MKLQKLYRYVRQATDEYNLIEDGDKIAVAVSGGKDSLALLYALAGLKRFYPASFTICAITIDIGFGMDFTPVQRLCDELDVPFFICNTQNKILSFILKTKWILLFLCESSSWCTDFKSIRTWLYKVGSWSP